MSKMRKTDSGLLLVSYGTDEEEDEEESSLNQGTSEGIDNISGSDDEGSYVKVNVKKAQKRPSQEFDRREERRPRIDREVHSTNKMSRLVSYIGDDMEEEDEEGDNEESKHSDPEVEASPESETYSNSRLIDYDVSILSENVQEFAGELQHDVHDEDDIAIPPEPPGKCSNKLQEKIADLHEKVHKRGYDMNASIQRRKDFRNPSIYEKLIEFCGIDEKGTNYPPELYDPTFWGPDSYYDELARLQKIEMDKREKEKKDRTKVEFVVGTKKTDGEKRKSKWDNQPQVTSLQKPTIITTTVLNPPVVSVTTSSSGTKTTVISAVGTITKKPK